MRLVCNVTGCGRTASHCMDSDVDILYCDGHTPDEFIGPSENKEPILSARIEVRQCEIRQELAKLERDTALLKDEFAELEKQR